MSTLATVVKVSASMKAVNMTDQHTPESHSVRERNSLPRQTLPRLASVRPMSRLSALKKLRQNVTSKPCACVICRDTMPAIDQSKVASTIRPKACA